MTKEQIEQNIALLQNLVSCNSDLPLWCYTGNFDLLYSTCPYEDVISSAFSYFGCMDQMKSYSEDYTVPVVLSTPLGLDWLAACEKQDGKIRRIYTLGPFFATSVSLDRINQILRDFQELDTSISWKQALINALKEVPTLSPLLTNYFAVMLHYCVTGEKRKISEIQYQHNESPLHTASAQQKNRVHTWRLERNLLRMIREGDLNYRDALSLCSNVSSGVPVISADPLRQAKDSVLVSITLYSRAAIEGGLSPELGYAIGDAYIQSLEDCKTTAEAGAIHTAMVEDFVQRVHRCRKRPNVSKQIQECCDYIETHTEDALSIELLASMVGYTDYYLSRKFKTETGLAVNDYIKIARTERAKFLLSTTQLSVTEIAKQLRFCSRSHFGQVFHKIAGCTPAEYREKAETA